MAENLNYAVEGSKCYNDSISNCNKYGRLYDWETAMKACPAGWHLPNDSEWNILFATAGTERTAGKNLKATSGWDDNNQGQSGNGTDTYGFAAFPGGYSSFGGFYNVGNIGVWWSANVYFYASETVNGHYMTSSGEFTSQFDSEKTYLLSVRCVKGEAPPTPSSSSIGDVGLSSSSSNILQSSSSNSNVSSSSVTTTPSSSSSSVIIEIQYGDPVVYGGQTYKTVVIGTQTWMAEDLNYNTTDGNYDFETAKTVCPNGWHLPSYVEWGTLERYVGGTQVAGKNLRDDTYGFMAGIGGLFVANGGIRYINDNSDMLYQYDSPGFGGKARVRCVKEDMCGSQSVNINIQFCHENMPYDLCNFKTYNPTNQQCGVGNVIETKCGNGWYDANNSNMRCEGNVLEMKCGGTEMYGGHTWYNTETQFCPNGTIKYYGKLTDSRDGKTYKTTEIGKTWMAENLNYDATGSMCGIDCDKYGRSYSLEAALNVCPDGWHLPSDTEWKGIAGLGGGALKAISGWDDYQGKSGNGVNSSGFSALPGGYGYAGGSYYYHGSGRWWSSSCMGIDIDSYGDVSMECYDLDKSYLFSVRCVED
jgi:uncharacterized protein (TIGR02145 family)